MSSTSYIPVSALAIAVLLLGWGLYQSRKFGKLGLLSWLQLVVLMSPWLVYFGLFLSGVFINFVSVLLLLVGSTAGYIFLGDQIRKVTVAQKSELPAQIAADVKLENPASKPELDKQVEDIKTIQGIFGIETFYATETLPYQEGVIFRGNLRGDPAEVHARLSQSLSDRLGNKYNLFLVDGQDQKPVVVVLPSKLSLVSTTTSQKVLVGVLVVATIYTTLAIGGQLHEIDITQHPEQYLLALPLALGIILILLSRELALRWMARKYQIRFSPPFLLPSLQLGAFGAFSRVQSTIPHRRALFDVAIAPALASGILSLVILLTGLVLSTHYVGNVQVPSQVFQSSVLVGVLAKLILGKSLHLDLIAIHPLVVLGWLGSVITALNLMPAGQLDGGRIVQAVYGRRTASWTTILTLIFLAIATLVNPLALYWGGIIFILLRDLERPMLNEVSELDGDRDALGLMALFWMLVTLLPMTPAVAARLGIG